ncbi:peptidoglycan editing factor PgeF [Psychrobium sp. 1_MG-2023]|nr:peptidoglycan editing factor PgeF [Psychrobium sp. 1_MG-2023]MDP2561859.1 peptidoglycan editing factor PgeF [Psychrobium sp. 1_MG-2023]PKF55877.1 peptidoglycan editing factor PgeF [Alteromonadales bacterium alter-6D02]
MCTTRFGGVSKPPFNSNNLALHVNDNVDDVNANRLALRELLPTNPVWLNQQHTTDVLTLDEKSAAKAVSIADASETSVRKVVCCVMTADCLPILLTDQYGEQVAAIHAGWRGMADGIIEKTLESFNARTSQIYAWLGPAISQKHFEVGQDVFDAFCHHCPTDKLHFTPVKGKYYANLYQLAIARLTRCGVNDISGGEYCTFEQSDLFFSFRREGVTGRMASVIWIE